MKDIKKVNAKEPDMKELEEEGAVSTALRNIGS